LEKLTCVKAKSLKVSKNRERKILKEYAVKKADSFNSSKVNFFQAILHLKFSFSKLKEYRLVIQMLTS
jgi:hypothetical protein